MNEIFSIDQINEIAIQIIAQNPNKVILFNGEMGVGKTTLIKQLCQILGVQEATSSPTFSIVNEYKAAIGMVYHFDVYRLKNENEAINIGIDDYLYSGNWCFIEWAEKIPNLIPTEHSTINIQTLENGKRQLTMK